MIKKENNNERSIPPPPKGRGFLDRGLMNYLRDFENEAAFKPLLTDSYICAEFGT